MALVACDGWQGEVYTPAVQAIAADVKDCIVQELWLGVHQEGQRILLVQAHLVRGQVGPQMLQDRQYVRMTGVVAFVLYSSSVVLLDMVQVLRVR